MAKKASSKATGAGRSGSRRTGAGAARKTTGRQPGRRGSGAGVGGFHEAVFAGSPRVLRGLLAGIALGSGEPNTAIDSYDAGISHEGLVDRVAELVKLHGVDSRVVLGETLTGLVRQHAERIHAETGLTLKSLRAVQSAELPFSFEVFARQYHDEIMAVLNELPEGLELRNFDQDVQEHPESRGPEGYAPEHHYAASGSGEVVGRIDLLVDLRRRLGDLPLVNEGEIKLILV
ncbi:MAG: hypothetical protein R6X25_16275 [Candidatus Krumholzibacteriia bacterium]